MIVKMSAPSKTFLAGEYSVLESGKALLINSSPRFELYVSEENRGECLGIPLGSPTGKMVREFNPVFQNFSLKFIDPHEGRGGFGASGAQFLMVYEFLRLYGGEYFKQPKTEFLKKLLQTYWSYTSNNLDSLESLADLKPDFSKPSGADLMSQNVGGLVNIDREAGEVKKMNWSFRDKSFFIVPTGTKIPTHEHLANLEISNFQELERLRQKLDHSLLEQQWPIFVKSVNEIKTWLKETELTAEHSSKFISTIDSWAEVEASKACGALGSDTIILFFDKSQKENLREKLVQEGLTPIATEEDISSGLEIKVEGGSL